MGDTAKWRLETNQIRSVMAILDPNGWLVYDFNRWIKMIAMKENSWFNVLSNRPRLWCTWSIWSVVLHPDDDVTIKMFRFTNKDSGKRALRWVFESKQTRVFERVFSVVCTARQKRMRFTGRFTFKELFIWCSEMYLTKMVVELKINRFRKKENKNCDWLKIIELYYLKLRFGSVIKC